MGTLPPCHTNNYLLYFHSSSYSHSLFIRVYQRKPLLSDFNGHSYIGGKGF